MNKMSLLAFSQWKNFHYFFIQGAKHISIISQFTKSEYLMLFHSIAIKNKHARIASSKSRYANIIY